MRALFGLEARRAAEALNALLGVLDALAHQPPVFLLGGALVLGADGCAALLGLGADGGAFRLRVRPDAGGYLLDSVHSCLPCGGSLNRC